MSSTGILIALVGLFIIVNANNLAYVAQGMLKFNTAGYKTPVPQATNPPQHHL